MTTETGVGAELITAETLALVGAIAAGIARRLPPVFDLDDLAAAGRVGLVDAARRFNPACGAPFEAYARVRIRGAIYDSVRRRHWREQMRERVSPNQAIEAGLDELVQGREVREFVAQLPATERKVIEARFFDGLDWQETAAALGISPAYGQACQWRALAHLRELMQGSGGKRRLVVVGKAKKVVEISKPNVAECKRRIAVVDELGAIETELAANKLKEARLKVLREDVKNWAADFPPSQPVIFEGLKYAAQVSARTSKKRIASMLKLFTAIGQKKFLSICSCTLKAAEEVLSPVQKAELIVEDAYVGDRSVKTMERAQIAA